MRVRALYAKLFALTCAILTLARLDFRAAVKKASCPCHTRDESQRKTISLSRPSHHVCFIVPLRDRALQADIFRTYLRGKMALENLPYVLILSKQSDGEYFNRGILLNVGFLALEQRNYACSVVYLHDVDMLPSSRLVYHQEAGQNVKYVRHLASQASQFGYRMPYETYLGGITGLEPSLFREVDGFSNDFWGWGGEDDDFYTRLKRMEVVVDHVEGATLCVSDGHTERDTSNQPANEKRLKRNTDLRNGLQHLRSFLAVNEDLIHREQVDESTFEIRFNSSLYLDRRCDKLNQHDNETMTMCVENARLV